MVVPLVVFRIASEKVQELYKNEPVLAQKERRVKRGFNELIRLVVKGMRLRDDERADLIHELAKFFGRRGGKTPRKKAAKQSCHMSMPVSSSLLRDMRTMALQANEHICPVE